MSTECVDIEQQYVLPGPDHHAVGDIVNVNSRSHRTKQGLQQLRAALIAWCDVNIEKDTPAEK